MIDIEYGDTAQDLEFLPYNIPPQTQFESVVKSVVQDEISKDIQKELDDTSHRNLTIQNAQIKKNVDKVYLTIGKLECYYKDQPFDFWFSGSGEYVLDGENYPRDTTREKTMAKLIKEATNDEVPFKWIFQFGAGGLGCVVLMCFIGFHWFLFIMAMICFLIWGGMLAINSSITKAGKDALNMESERRDMFREFINRKGVLEGGILEIENPSAASIEIPDKENDFNTTIEELASWETSHFRNPD